MRWRKLGRVYVPTGDLWWARAYAFLPTAEVIDDQVIRVYFASLDENRFGRVGYVELDVDNPERVLFQKKEPVLDIGELGTFDDSGVNASSIVNVNGEKYLYYIGWQRCERVPYMLFTGLAISENAGKTFKKYSRVPVLDRTPAEPFSRSAPCVLVESGVFKMWYWSCQQWTRESRHIHYNNVIRYAESNDGIHWNSTEKVCIAPEESEVYSVGRPWVIKDGIYKMWYSIRSKRRPSYRIGYAESHDGLNWERKDNEVGIRPSETGWDSEMICFSSVVDVKGERYMFYNGNRHGSTGFGCAVLES